VSGYGRGARQATGTAFALRIVGLTVVQGAISLWACRSRRLCVGGYQERMEWLAAVPRRKRGERPGRAHGKEGRQGEQGRDAQARVWSGELWSLGRMRWDAGSRRDTFGMAGWEWIKVKALGG
jgi:hypothetical protein